MEENSISDNDNTNANTGAYANVCIFCLRCQDDKEKLTYYHQLKKSQNIFSACSKYLRSVKFWKNFQWSCLLNQAPPLVCYSCYTSAEKIFEVNRQMQDLQRSMKALIRAFTNEVIKFRKLNIKDEAQEFPNNDSRTNENVSSTMPMSICSIPAKEEQNIMPANYAENETEYYYEDTDIAPITESYAIGLEGYSSNSPGQVQYKPDTLTRFTNSSGYENTILLRGLHIKLKRLPSVYRKTSHQSRNRVKNSSKKTTNMLAKKTSIGKKLSENQATSIKVYKCSVCEHSTNDFKEIKSHVKAHVNEGEIQCTKSAVVIKTYQCRFCMKILKTPRAFTYHAQIHTHQEGLVCNICGKTLLNKETHKQHVKLHASASYKCQYCDRVCKTKISLHRHTISAHTKETPFECQLCPKKFKMKIELNKHVRRHEERRTRPHLCTVCGKTYTRQTHLKHHMKIHNGEQLQCNYDSCTRKFNSKYSLNHHVKLVHTKEISFFCEICGQNMKDKYSLDLHTRRHTGEKPYQCQICGKPFLRKQYLDDHSKTHTGEFFQCTLCPRTILNKSNFKKHMRTHQNDTATTSSSLCEIQPF